MEPAPEGGASRALQLGGSAWGPARSFVLSQTLPDRTSPLANHPCRAYIKSEAVLRIAQGLNMPLALLAGLAFLVPRQLSDAVYDQVRSCSTGWDIACFVLWEAPCPPF